MHIKVQDTVAPVTEVDSFINEAEAFVEGGIFYHKLAEVLLGEDATLESIHTISHDIEKFDMSRLPLDESSTDDEGISLVGAALGIGKRTAARMVNEPKTASVLFRALRDKLEDMEDKAKRNRAEEGGFLATVIYTIKKAIAWLYAKFKDIRDDFYDMVHDKEVGSSRAKRDYVWLVNKNVDYMANNAKWF